MDRARRKYLLTGAALGAVAALPAIAKPPRAEPTAADVVARIRGAVGVPWQAETVDRIVAGDPATPVRGIATTMMATLDVLREADAAGWNLVVAHEPTFWSHLDTTDALADDPLYRRKAEFIAGKRLVVFRFHDPLACDAARRDRDRHGARAGLGVARGGGTADVIRVRWRAAGTAGEDDRHSPRCALDAPAGRAGAARAPCGRTLGLCVVARCEGDRRTRRCRPADLRRDPGMGAGAVRAGPDRGRRAQGADRAQPRRLGTGGDALLRGMAAHRAAGGAGRK